MAIENKIKSTEHSNQLTRYREIEYSWYSPTGKGFRIDHFFVSEKIKVIDCYYLHYLREENSSDHSGMVLEFEV